MLVALIVLLNAVPSDAIGVPAPPQCPWQFSDYPQAILPYGSTIPRNASFWIREYGSAYDLTVVDKSTSSSIAVDEIAIQLTSTLGRFIELRPRALLKANTEYELQFGVQGLAGSVTTTSTTDEAAPAIPTVTAARAINSPYEVCETAGLVIDVADPGEPVIHLITAPDGSLYELGSNFAGLNPNRVVPTEPNASIDFQVIAMDLAGNRSDATPSSSAMAGETPIVTGRGPFIDQQPDQDAGGCRCVASDAGASAWLLLALVALCRRRAC
jgi:hypothetical protein